MKAEPTYQKLRGGYYTPQVIADFLSAWAIRSRKDSILEPSCGDGIFIEAAGKRLMKLGADPKDIPKQLRGYEIDALEAAKADGCLRALGVEEPKVSISCTDFFRACAQHLGDETKERFDAILGNPPFIRYQNFPEAHRQIAFFIMRQAGFRPSRLTNAWLPFVVSSALLLKPDGRLAMVLPAELMQVNYAAELRLFLSKFFHQINVLSFRRLAFEGIQEEVLLLLAERAGSGHTGIDVVELDDIEQLLKYEHRTFGLNGLKSLDHTTEKWTQYYLSEAEIDLLRQIRRDACVKRLGELADTDIGIVTGMNDFFALNDSQAKEKELVPFTKYLVSRSNQLKGITFDRRDWLQSAKAGQPVRLLDLPAVEADRLPLTVRSYLREGENQGLHLGYKCRIRKLWYAVPSVYVPGGFLLRQIHHYPKLVINEMGATCTDTIHRVRFRKGIDPHRVAAAFLNSLTFAFSEIIGRSYGGGVLELEPNEADSLPVPIAGGEELDAGLIDKLVRSGDIEKVLEYTDSCLLRKGLGLSSQEVHTLHTIWKKLQGRRTNRRNGAKSRIRKLPLLAYSA